MSMDAWVPIPDSARRALLSKYSSRRNKMHLVIGWKYFHNWYIDLKWEGEEFESRMLFRFSPDGPWVQAKSFDEDMLPTFKFGKEEKKGKKK